MSTTPSTAVTTPGKSGLALSEQETINVLRTSLYPGAAVESVKMVLGYCKAAGLDPFQKPVHIVPMWDRAAGGMRDVVMPGIGLYRTQAARTGQYAGVTEPEYGPDITDKIDGVTVTFPEWSRVSVLRRLDTGEIGVFTAKEFWIENYAVKGGKEKSTAPNAMWMRRPKGQIAKCAEAQALRKAFPEIGSQPTAEEMEGKAFDQDTVGAEPLKQTKEDLAKAALEAMDPVRRKSLENQFALVSDQDHLEEIWAGLDRTKGERLAMESAKDAAKARIMDRDRQANVTDATIVSESRNGPPLDDDIPY